MSPVLREGPARVSRPARVVTTAGAVALAFTSLVAVGVGAAHADTVTDTSIEIDFSSAGYDPDAEHAPHDQNGWRNAQRDVIDAGLQGDALRMSNAVTASAISQVRPPSLVEAAGEPSTGASYNQFTAEFSVASATGEFQPGLRLEIAPDNGTGARTGGTFVLHHNPATGNLELGAFWSDAPKDDDPSVWHNAVLASLDPKQKHDVKLVHTFRVEQPDTVDVYVNGAFVRTVGTYEEYHRVASSTQFFTIDTLLFRASTSIPDETGRGLGEIQAAVPAHLGNGFLISDISYGVANATSEPVGTSIDIDLAGPGYLSTTIGAPGKQNGWTRGFAGLDNEIVDGKLRISNATVSGVQTQLVAPRLDVAAGHPELDAEYDGFETSFRIAAVDNEFQPGLRLEVVPDNGSGARTGGSFILHHNPDSGMLDIGGLWTELSTPLANDWKNWFSDVLISVDPTVAHDVRLRHVFVEDGQDIVDVYVDGAYVGTTGTYEEYHNAQGNAPQEIRTVLFKASQSVPDPSGRGWATQPPVPALEGKGFLLDQLSYRVFDTAAPAAPASATAVFEGTDAVTASWTAPTGEATSQLTGYAVRLVASSGAIRTVPVDPDARSHTFTHLAPGSYRVTVDAVYSTGQTARTAAESVVVPALGAPAAPAAPSISAVGDDGARVTWSAPADGGAAVTGYSVTLRSSSGALRTATTDAATTSHTFTGLPAGQYTATVTARNAVGPSAASAASAAITVRSAVTIHRPFFSQNRQIFRSKDRATVSVVVHGAEGQSVEFFNKKIRLGSAKVVNGMATLRLKGKLPVRKYNAVVARFAGDATRLPAESVTAPNFRVVRTGTAKRIRVTGKKFQRNARPRVTIRAGRFDNGRWATGKLRIRVNGKVVRTVTLRAKDKGRVTVRLPKSNRAVKVRAGFKKTKTTKKSWSKVTRIQVR